MEPAAPDLWASVAAWPVAAALRRSAPLYAAVNAAHILGIGLLLGAVATLDLRLLGAFARAPVGVLGPPLVRVAGTGLAMAAMTGLVLFTVRPAEYAGNPAFLSKLGLVAIAVLNLAAIHRSRAWRRALDGDAPGAMLRLGAGVSLVAWVSAVMAGRWIGFAD